MSVSDARRVVFLPGASGTVLADGSLTPAQARAECERNLGAVAERLLRGSALYPCDKRPELLWGDVGSLHWFFRPPAWLSRMTSGNGLDVAGAVHPDKLVDVDIRLRGRRFAFQPYTSFLQAMRSAGADVRVFPYDWRLSNHHNAGLLYRQIQRLWFPNRRPDAGEPVPDRDRVTLIGHSMGGLIARCLVESGAYGAPALVRRVITIGTPHLGAPQSYLHLIGRTRPLPENPFYRWANAVLGLQMAAAGATTPTGFGTQFLPAGVQTAVLAHMASAFELLPTYDFVTDRGRTEPIAESYRALRHTGTGRPAASVIAEFRRSLAPVPRLPDWLHRHRITYHFVAATGWPTAVGYDRGRDRIIARPDGDRTVPLASARPVPRSTGNLYVATVGADGGLSHQQLCERPDVQAYCRNVLTGAGAATRPTAARPASARAAAGVGPLQPEDLLAMARTILRETGAPPYRGIVLSISRLTGTTGPLIDPTTTASSPGRRPRLINPPRHLSSPEVYSVQSPRHGRFRYVWMLSNERGAVGVGGVVFLPRARENVLHLVTFNVGQLDNRRCGNDHHAETQLIRWVDEQRPSWRAGIEIVLMQNRSRRSDAGGYSPCSGCCVDLATFLTSLRTVRGGRPTGGAITWLELYDRGEACGHPTDAANLRRLTDSGWTLQGPKPVQRELSPVHTTTSWHR